MGRSCGGGRTGGALEMLRTALCLLLGRSGFFAAFLAAASATITARATVTAITTIVAVKPITAAFVALAITVGLAHHCGGAFLVRVDADGEVAQHVFGNALLALDLGKRGRRRVDLEHCEVRLAVLLDAERKALDAPVFRIADEFSAEALDDAFVAGGHLLDLLRAQILAR